MLAEDTKLLKACEREKWKGIVESRICRYPRNSQRVGGGGSEACSGYGVSSACVAQPEIVQETYGERVRFSEDRLLSEHTRKTQRRCLSQEPNLLLPHSRQVRGDGLFLVSESRNT